MSIVVMGPSGSGKSVVGVQIAAVLGVPFVDADDLHPDANVRKMSEGIPLTDDDRMPWLDVVGAAAAAPADVVIACSALARRYRDRLRAAAPDVCFVELRVARAELDRRMHVREHFMPPSLLGSQLNTLESLHADERGVIVENTGTVENVAERAIEGLRAQSLR